MRTTALILLLAVAPPSLADIDTDLVSAANSKVSPARLRSDHIMLAREPHIAGTPGDARVIESLLASFTSMGLAPTRHDIWPLLATPVSASLDIISPDPVSLSLKESPALGDADSAHPELTFGWNAYSASGDVTAGVVYANYGREEDFDALAAQGVELKGKIVLARYGGNYRGYKARFAQLHDAAGLIIFSDPADVGFTKGPVYPQGTFFNDCCIQRGSIVTLPYQGDPLTPGTPATESADRIREEDTELPRIPVQPVSYGAAKEILARMTGEPAPESWRGGLPLTYRTTDGDSLTVRLHVEQRREIRKTSNVLAVIEGAEFPDEKIIIGAHHDAWNHGASDPTCGTIVVLEAARVLAELAREGHRPARTIVFAAWGAEEFGIIGSSEWVEANHDDLLKNGVAYLNLDMASMGPNFSASASPSLKSVIARCTSLVPSAANPQGTSIADIGFGDIGTLGGGSDHVAFLCHTGVASAAFGSGGSSGSAYHSAYDTLPWYWKAVGADYASAAMVTRMTCAFAIGLAYQRVLPLNPETAFADAATHASSLASTDPEWATWAKLFSNHRLIVASQLAKLLADPAPADARRINRALLDLDRAWLGDGAGLPGRPWFRNLYVSTDESSGYASWVLPALTGALKHKSDREMSDAQRAYRSVLSRTLETFYPLPPDLSK